MAAIWSVSCGSYHAPGILPATYPLDGLDCVSKPHALGVDFTNYHKVPYVISIKRQPIKGQRLCANELFRFEEQSSNQFRLYPLLCIQRYLSLSKGFLS